MHGVERAEVYTRLHVDVAGGFLAPAELRLARPVVARAVVGQGGVELGEDEGSAMGGDAEFGRHRSYCWEVLLCVTL